MADYETLRQRHVTQFQALLPEHLQRTTWPAERLRAEREQRLRTLVHLATERSPWHRARLAHIDADTLTEDGLERIPPMTKDEMMADFDGIVTDPRLHLELVETHIDRLASDGYLLDEFHAVASGGSSGRRGVFVYDWDGWMLAYLTMTRFAIRGAMGGKDFSTASVVAAVSAEKPSHMTSALTQTFSGGMGTARLLPATLPLHDIVARLNELQPDFLSGYSSMLYGLALEAREGRLRILPKGVSVTSEPLLPEMRAAIEKAWNAPVGNVYGTSEGASAGACGDGHGMHLNEDLCIFEPVDDDSRPVPPGVRASKLYITNLFNLAQPLIRYELTDEVLVIDEPCLCGSAMRRIDDIQGRLDDCFEYEGGLVIHPLAFRSPIGRDRNIVEYQVRQTARGADVAIRALGGVDVEPLNAEIEAQLERAGLREPEVTIELVSGFERQETGKLKRFFPLPAPGDRGSGKEFS